MHLTLIHASAVLSTIGVLLLSGSAVSLYGCFSRRDISSIDRWIERAVILLGLFVFFSYGDVVNLTAWEKREVHLLTLVPLCMLFGGIVIRIITWNLCPIIEIHRGKRYTPWWAEAALLIVIFSMSIILPALLLKYFAGWYPWNQYFHWVDKAAINKIEDIIAPILWISFLVHGIYRFVVWVNTPEEDEIQAA